MKAVIIDGNKKLSIIEKEMPKKDGKRVIIKVIKGGICGSDIHFWEDGDQYKGIVLGHEYCGTVIDPGELKDTLKEGDRVVINPLRYCGKCEFCKKGQTNLCPVTFSGNPDEEYYGSFAEYVAIHPEKVRKLPDEISDDAAAMIEPTAVTLRAVKMAGVNLGDKVLISGGGIIGLLCAALARLNGASYVVLTEINPYRLQKALEFKDVNEVFDASDKEIVDKLIKASGGGFDKFIDCVGIASSINPGLMALKSGGTAVYAGLSFEPQPINVAVCSLKEIDLKFSISLDNEDFDKSIDLIAKGYTDVERFITNRVSIDEAQEAFEKLVSKENTDIKVLVEL